MTRIELIAKSRLPLRSALGAGLAVSIGTALNLAHPIYALVSAIVVTDVTAQQTRALGVQRIVGTLFGTVVGAVLSQVTHPNSLAVAIGVVTAMLLCTLFGIPAGAKVAGYLSGMVILTFGDHPWAYAVDRLVETLLGIASALTVALVPPLHDPVPGAAPTDAGRHDA